MNNPRPSILQNGYPVAMYDCSRQKCVAVFKTKAIASKYVFDTPVKVTTNAIRDKVKFLKNPYSVPLTFRTASEAQSLLIPRHHQWVIIDEDFNMQTRIERVLKLKESPSYDINTSHGRSQLTMKTLAAAKLGYTPVEIAKQLSCTPAACTNVLRNTVYITSYLGDTSIENLEELIALLHKRIELIKQGEIQ